MNKEEEKFIEGIKEKFRKCIDNMELGYSVKNEFEDIIKECREYGEKKVIEKNLPKIREIVEDNIYQKYCNSDGDIIESVDWNKVRDGLINFGIL